jgi:hypothetical protein
VNQQIVSVANATLAIGVLAELKVANATTCRINFTGMIANPPTL